MSKSRALANRERQAQSARRSRIARNMVMALATVLTFATLSLLAADRLYRPDTFKIDKLKIKGKLRHLAPSEIEQLVAKQEIGNFFSIELEAIKAEIEALAWVQQAEVRREWPDTLLIAISEHRPVMRWNDEKWVTSKGQVVDLPSDLELGRSISLHGPEQDSELMLHKAYAWKKQLAKSGLELLSLELSGSHAWSMAVLDSDSGAEFDVLLGRDQVEHRLSRFQGLFEKSFRNSNQQLQRVDARYPDGLAIKSSSKKPDETDAVSDSALAARN